MAKKLCFIFASQKGGVGKTFLAMSLLEHLRYRSDPPAKVDADHRNKSLRWRYALKDESGEVLPNESQALFAGVIGLDRATGAESRTILQALGADADFVVIDCAAAAEHDLRAIFPNEATMGKVFERAGCSVVVALPFDEQPDSSQAALSVVDLFGSHATCLIVQNRKSQHSGAELERRFAEISEALDGRALMARGSAMHAEGLEVFSQFPDESFHALPGRAERDDPVGGMLAGAWVDEFLDRQSPMWAVVIGHLRERGDGGEQ